MTVRILETPLVAPAALGGAAAQWYPSPPRGIAAWQARCKSTADSSGDWLTPLRPAFGSGARLLERVAGGTGVVVTTGQQPGLFGGPWYTWHKAMSALELAARIERDTGVKAVPVFWAATDDADFSEAAVTSISTPTGAERLTLTQRPPDGVPMSHATLGAEVGTLLDALRASAGSVADDRPMRAAESFRLGASVGGAHVEMLRALLEPLGMAVIDAAHSAVGAASRAHLEAAGDCAAVIQNALVAQRDAVLAAGADVPVDIGRELSLVFAWEPGQDGLPRKRRLTIEEAARAVRRDTRLSPNVLLRPVVERLILPTVAYLAGPGEMAYFAQVNAVASALGAPPPMALPRWSGIIVADDVDTALAHLQMSVEDLRDPHAAEARAARAGIPDSAKAALADLTASIGRELDRLAGSLPDPALDGARKQFALRAERLERRIVTAAKHRAGNTLRVIAAARGALFPFGQPQERALNAVPLWSRNGDALTRALRAACAAHAERLINGGAAGL
jgi:bacillithiol biosynthesis cysteine-adding enzyme BshC